MATQPGERGDRDGYDVPRRPAPESRGYRRQIDCTPADFSGTRGRDADGRSPQERRPVRSDPSD